MPLHLSPHDRRLLRGDAGDGARLAMRLVVKAAEVAGAPRLIDIGSAHVGSCYAPGGLGSRVAFGSLAECVRSAVAGRVVRDEHLWPDR